MASGIALLDNVGGEVFAAVKEGTQVRVDGDTVYARRRRVATGTPQDASHRRAMLEAKAGLSSHSRRSPPTPSEFMRRERALLLDGVGIPESRRSSPAGTSWSWSGASTTSTDLQEAQALHPRVQAGLIGVDGGADALPRPGTSPHLSSATWTPSRSGAALAAPRWSSAPTLDGRAPGLARVQDLGIEPSRFRPSARARTPRCCWPTRAAPTLIVAVGTHATLNEFLDKGRGRHGVVVPDPAAVGGQAGRRQGRRRLYRNRISAAALLLLVFAALSPSWPRRGVRDRRLPICTDGPRVDWDDILCHWVRGLSLMISFRYHLVSIVGSSWRSRSASSSAPPR